MRATGDRVVACKPRDINEVEGGRSASAPACAEPSLCTDYERGRR